MHSLYTTALVALTILLTAGQILTQYRLNNLQKNIQFIRYASLQRHQSQQLISKALQLRDASQLNDFRTHHRELKQIFDGLESSYSQSSSGRINEWDITIENSPKVRAMFDGLRPIYTQLARSTRTILSFQTPEAVQSPIADLAMQQLLQNQNPFLGQVDAIVRQYNAEIREKIVFQEWIEFAFYILTLAVVLYIGLKLFRPAIRQLNQTIDQLIAAENTTAETNRKLVRLNRSLHEARQRLFQATKQQHQQEINDQKLRSSLLIAGQEEERKRLSRELHDGLGQMMTAIKLQVEGLETHLNRVTSADDPVATKRIRALKDLIAQTISETRSISNDLMPSVLSDFGIIPALKMLAETALDNQAKTNNPAPDIRFETNLPSGRLDRHVEISLYRITQEAVTNAIRHGKPTQITIELIERENYLHLVVADNGSGFYVQRLQEPHGPSQGIHNMQERTKLLNGRFVIRSTPGKGTKLFVSIPYQVHFSAYEQDTTNAR
ncbi:histidine kinase [Rudanella paleaurantiibacter]|uniref:histidine kinase n=1 Tax=Rudanella paleaurantiibacter TaxID=2614655 RepID=A0A7J5U252_9BACT|nr:histidine kinase [Rudanella paleaurantiibacter]